MTTAFQESCIEHRQIVGWQAAETMLVSLDDWNGYCAILCTAVIDGKHWAYYGVR